MPAYVIADVEVFDFDGFKEYLDRMPEILARYGVEYVVRGGETDVLEGDWNPTRLVILRFDDMEHARRWYSSDEYQEMVRLRQRASRTDMVAVDGYRAPA